jgi:hypothetical protein
MKLPAIAVTALAISALVGGTALAQVTMQPIPNPPEKSMGHAMGKHHHWHGKHHKHTVKHHVHVHHHVHMHHHMKAKATAATPAPDAATPDAATPPS